jgi:hypothetical protein
VVTVGLTVIDADVCPEFQLMPSKHPAAVNVTDSPVQILFLLAVIVGDWAVPTVIDLLALPEQLPVPQSTV